jgi:hypothetical protein
MQEGITRVYLVSAMVRVSARLVWFFHFNRSRLHRRNILPDEHRRNLLLAFCGSTQRTDFD